MTGKNNVNKLFGNFGCGFLILEKLDQRAPAFLRIR
jgi:uncharacterized protein YutD